MTAGFAVKRRLQKGIPGRYTVTSRSAEEAPALTWSRDNFVGSAEKYAVLAEAVPNCVQMKLAYQVTDTDGAQFEDMLGTRTVYVNDGSVVTNVTELQEQVADWKLF